ncbi:MAG: hypothetical protein QM689_01920 [Oscillospiraceae bacterium]
MNMVYCTERCRHQKDGYCILEYGATVTNAVDGMCECCYFSPMGVEEI